LTIILPSLQSTNMQRIKLVIEYDGTDFYGWQIQPQKRTVQGELEQALRIVYREQIRIEGAGRTDRGVHAYGQVASLNVPEKFTPHELNNAMNGNVGSDVLIKQCLEVSSDFHARFSAKSRIYQYQIYNGKSVFRRRYFQQVKEELKLSLMKEAAKKIIGEREFSHLATKDKGICNIKDIDITKEGNTIYITVEADHFLRRLVLGIVGLLLAVGKENLPLGDVEGVISGRLRRFPVAPPNGLFLLKVLY